MHQVSMWIATKCLDILPTYRHPCTVQQILDEEKSKHACLSQKNGFGLTFWHRMLRQAKGTVQPSTCCWLVRWFDSSRWVAILRSSTFQFQFYQQGLEKVKDKSCVGEILLQDLGDHSELQQSFFMIEFLLISYGCSGSLITELLFHYYIYYSLHIHYWFE